MNNENTSITTLTGQGDTLPSRYSSPSAGKRRNTMRHTEGKWTVCLDQNSIPSVMKSNDLSFRIATMLGDGEEDKANANLIASAPEMLSLLKRFLEAPGYKEGRDNTKWMLLEEMKAITIKAEGK